MRSAVSLFLRRAFAQASGGSIDFSRRDFLKKSVAATLAFSFPLQSCVTDSKPTIAIIGGGIAGLTASYHFNTMNIKHTVYEASGRVGGRVLTVEDAVVKNAYVDFGAEFIDSVHTELIALAKKLNVEIVDLQKDQLTSKAYFFDGQMRTEKDVVDALMPFAKKLSEDVSRLPDEIHFSKADQFKDLDAHSVTSYLKSIGIEGWLLHFFEMAMEGEYAMNADKQSALNLLVMLATPFDYSDHYHLLGSDHEVFKFKGGTQRFVDALSREAIQNCKLQHKLKKISKKNGAYILQFDTPEKQEEVSADYIVLALPHTVLRNVERDFSFSERKEKWIAEAGFGNAVKVAMGFNKRIWREAGYQGYTFSDVNRTVFWDSSQLLPTAEGSLSFAGGGDSAQEMATKSYEQIREKWLMGTDKIFPGVANAYNGNISKFIWATNPYSKGSYTCYSTGQWSEFAGVEAEPFENIFFAGEHCSINHQGFMNGAVETASKAANEIQNRMSGLG